MNLKEYLSKKENLKKKIADNFRPRCLKCLRSPIACLCHHLQPFATQTRFIILMHPKEAKKEKIGTGRLTHLSLTNSKIIIGENFDQNKEVSDILKDELNQSFILYPGKSSHNLDKTAHPLMNQTQSKIVKKTHTIFVIDGTWSCAKSMMRDSLSLHSIPRISFDTNKVSQFFIKQQPTAFCLSTIESVYHVLESLHKWGAENLQDKPHNNLLCLLERMCHFQKECTLLPSKNRYRAGEFKAIAHKKVSKKWAIRKIYFE